MVYFSEDIRVFTSFSTICKNRPVILAKNNLQKAKEKVEEMILG
ncbi:hypothetical protein ACFL23_04635 [Patescibacteria group bacterium]